MSGGIPGRYSPLCVALVTVVRNIVPTDVLIADRDPLLIPTGKVWYAVGPLQSTLVKGCMAGGEM